MRVHFVRLVTEKMLRMPFEPCGVTDCAMLWLRSDTGSYHGKLGVS